MSKIDKYFYLSITVAILDYTNHMIKVYEVGLS